MPQVSVIIPVYNGENYIREALESVFAQTFRDLEVIVVNDGSTDRTEEYLRSYSGRIVYLTNGHKGPGPSRNLGIKAARGDLIAFLDADDLWLPKKIQRQVEVAERYPEFGVITTDAAVFDHSGILAASSKGGEPIASGHVIEKLLFRNWIGLSCAMVRRECLQKVGGFDEDPFVTGEDWVLWMRIAADYPVYFVDEVLVHYRLHPQSYSRANLEKQFLDLLINLQKIERIPYFAERPQLLREAKFRICWGRSWDNLRGGQTELARDKLRRCIRLKPYNPRVWGSLVLAHTPSAVLRIFKSAISAARKMRAAPSAMSVHQD